MSLGSRDINAEKKEQRAEDFRRKKEEQKKRLKTLFVEKGKNMGKNYSKKTHNKTNIEVINILIGLRSTFRLG